MSRINITWGEVVRFGIVGLIATAVHYGIYLLCQLIIPVNIAYSVGWIISLALNFYLSSRFTFRRNMSAYRAGGFITAHIVNYLLHIGLFNLFLWLGFDQTIAPLFVFCIVIPINFILVRFAFTKLP